MCMFLRETPSNVLFQLILEPHICHSVLFCLITSFIYVLNHLSSYTRLQKICKKNKSASFKLKVRQKVDGINCRCEVMRVVST